MLSGMTVATPFSDFRYLTSNTIRPLSFLPSYPSKSSALTVSISSSAYSTSTNNNNHIDTNNSNGHSSCHKSNSNHSTVNSAPSSSTLSSFSTCPLPAANEIQSQTLNNHIPRFDPKTLLQDRECDLAFYQEHFLNINHHNFVAAQSPQGPIAVSIAIDQKGCVRILIRTTQGSERIEHPLSELSIPWYRKLLGNIISPSPFSILSQVCPTIPLQSLEICSHRALPRELERMDERQIIRCYKFGIISLLPGQTLEYQGLTNTRDSCTPAFMDFLSWLGEPIRLKGWNGYRAGLDVIGDTTGETSVYTQWNGYQIMYHCAPMIPFNPNDHQQVERRRFIGNDIVVIVFKEHDDNEHFDLSSVGSRQNHIICIVRPIPAESPSQPKSYRVTLAVKEGIRNFSPLHFPTILQHDDASRDLFLLKLICGERAAYKAKAFATQLSRTRESLLRDVIEAHQ